MSISSLPQGSSLPNPPAPFQTSPQAERPAPAPHRHEPRQAPLQSAQDQPSSTTPAQPESITKPSAEVATKLSKIAELLSRDNLIKVLRDPYAKETQQFLKELRAQLSDDSLKTLTRDPAEMKQLRDGIGKVLSAENIHALQHEAAHLENPALTPEKIRERTAKTDPEESYMASQQVHKEINDEEIHVRQRQRLSGPLSKSLIGIGKAFNHNESQVEAKNTPSTPDKNPSPKQKKLSSGGPQQPSGAEDVQSPSKPATSTQVIEKLRRIGELLSRESLIRMLREPDAEHSTQRIEELRTLLSEDSLNSLSQDPKEQTQLRTALHKVLDYSNLRALEREALATKK